MIQTHPSRLVHHILDHPEFYPKDKFIIVILGRCGPTGKTWLTKTLRNYGYTAVEISETVFEHVEYLDSRNHFVVDPTEGIITIILNKVWTWVGHNNEGGPS